MSLGAALGQTWKRALLFAAVFVVISPLLDAMFDHSVDWTARALTITIATALYWLFSAWALTRRQG